MRKQWNGVDNIQINSLATSDCKILRQKVRSFGRQLENGIKSREEFLLVKRRYMNLIRRKKREFQKSESIKLAKTCKLEEK